MHKVDALNQTFANVKSVEWLKKSVNHLNLNEVNVNLGLQRYIQ